MAGSRPPKPPSAMDGYRRLERTRSVSGAGAVRGSGEVKARVRRSPRLTSSRVAGAMRLIAFVGVLALIVGTSVSLASADERSAAKPVAKPSVTKSSAAKAAPSKSEAVVEASARGEDVSTSDGATVIDATDDAPAPASADAGSTVAETADAVAVDPAAAAGTASGELPQAGLPLTGDVQVRWLLLGGSMLVLVGMLVQVAGQPLPARTRASARA